MKTSDTIGKISLALLKAQRKMGAATKDAKNPFFKSNYADLGSVMEVCKDPLNEEGIVILQPVSSNEAGHFVETRLLHESGEFISTESMRLELNKVDMQQLGSAITYARRYQLQSLLSIPAEDDDGEKSMNRNAPTQQAKPAAPAKPAPAPVKQPEPAKAPVAAPVKTAEQKELEILAKEGLPQTAPAVKAPVTEKKPTFNKPTKTAPGGAW